MIYILDGAGNIVDTAEATDSDTNLATGLATDIHAQDVTSEELNIVYAERSVNGSGAIYRKVWGEDATEIFDLSGK